MEGLGFKERRRRGEERGLHGGVGFLGFRREMREDWSR